MLLEKSTNEKKLIGSEKMLMSVILHELAHFINNDCLLETSISLIYRITIIFLSIIIYKRNYKKYGKISTMLFINVVVFFLDFLYTLFYNAISKICEFKADAVSVEYGYGKYLIDFLLKYKDYGEETDKHAFYDLLKAHPSHYCRIEKLKNSN